MSRIKPLNPKNKGALHRMLDIAPSKKISVRALEKAKHAKSPLERKRANFALNARKWHHK